MKTTTALPDAETIRAQVRAGYGQIANHAGTCAGSTPGCCGSAPADASALAQQIGYSSAELAALPEGANLGLSCGNPNALAALQPGETVLDLGSGGGFDVFIAGRNVGASGRAIGVDMTADMVAKARRNTAAYRERSGLDNVEFRLGEIEHLPVADASVDVVLSNCVINLSPDKPQVWREIARVLKPGGRVAVSDLALLQPLPPAVGAMVEALVGCVAGAVTVAETERLARAAGLVDLVLTPKSAYIDQMVDWQDPLYQKIVAHLPPGSKASDFITSLEVRATKPGLASPAAVAVYDPPLCCSTGVCGPDVDPNLVRFAADLQWLTRQGVKVERYNLAQSPMAFAANEVVRAALTDHGEAALPLVQVDGQVKARGQYPTRSELAAWTRLPAAPADATEPAEPPACCCAS
jgi:SAM-dependent methyltransferase